MTKEVFIFGFPLGEQLGKEITVRKSSVASLRKENGQLSRVQVLSETGRTVIRSGNSLPVARRRYTVGRVETAAVSDQSFEIHSPAVEFSNGDV